MKVALSTASVYPESTATAFEIAARLGYDGVEVMVWTDPVSQDVDALRRLSDYHRMPVLAVHAPCLLITQRVWSTDPWIMNPSTLTPFSPSAFATRARVPGLFSTKTIVSVRMSTVASRCGAGILVGRPT